ncbi:MAG: hypothetical protein CML94_02870 [Rhodobiaceae bacterium]|nr:hypothetical protein [Rhodobiaceae bacterium]
MFLIYQNIIKLSSSIFGLFIFAVSFFLLQLSVSFINITPIEFLIKPLLIGKFDDYENNFSEAILYLDNERKTINAKIKIDLINNKDKKKYLLSSKAKKNLNDAVSFKNNYSFSSRLIDKNIQSIKKYDSIIIKTNGKINSSQLEINASGSFIPVSLVKSLWPANIANGAKNWVQKNLSNGVINDLSLKADIPLDSFKISKKLDKKNINLKFNFSKMTISFLKEMDSIYNSSGNAILDGQSFKVSLEKGQVIGKNHQSIDIFNSKFIAKEITKKHGPAEILINAKGSIDDIMIFIYQHPRNFKRFVPLKLENISANSEVKVQFNFPLKSKLGFEEFIINSSTNLTDVSVNDIFSRDFESNLLSINLTNDGLDIVGKINFSSQILNLILEQDFKKKDNSTLISLSGSINEKMINSFTGDNFKFSGTANIETNFIGNSFDLRKGDLFIDFRNTKIESYVLDWAKPKFSPMFLKSNINFSNKEINFYDFKIEGSLIEVNGNFKFKSNKIANISIEKFRSYSSKDTISNNFSFKYNNTLSSSLELSVLGDILSIGRDGLSNLLNANNFSDNFENIIINIFFDELRSKSKLNFKNAQFFYNKKLNKLTDLSLNIFLNSESIIFGELSEQKNIKEIKLFTKNFESLIDVLGLNVNLIGGPIHYKAIIKDLDGLETFSGDLNVGGFSILKLPIFAKLLDISIPNLTFDNNSGIEFNSASAKININSKGIFIDDGVIRAKSDIPIFDNSLGMSISGIYGFSEPTNIEGTLVPLAGINMAPSKIPIIGDLFKGDNKGDGLIGIKYKIYEDKNGSINIQSNPLSILTPGILQRIF